MKRKFAVIGILSSALLHCNVVLSQKWTLDFSTGYHIPVVSDYGYYIDYFEDDASESVDFNSKRFGFSKGFSARLNLGYRINNEVSIQLGTQYLSGSSIEYSSLEEYMSGSISSTSTDISEWNYQMMSLHLGLSLNKQINDKISLYVNAGPMFNLLNSIKNSDDFHYEEFDNGVLQDTYETHRLYETDSYFRSGIYSDLGLNWRLNGKMELFFVGSMRSYPQTFKRKELIEYTVNGLDRLSALSKAAKETQFVDSYNSNELNPSVPNKELKKSSSNASLGFNVGIRFLFGGTMEEAESESKENSSRFYFSATAGYGIRFNGDYFETTKALNGNTEHYVTPFCFGNGLNYQLRTGFRLMEGFSLETGFMYHSGKTSFFNESDYSNPFYISRGTSDYNYSSLMLRAPFGIRLERSETKVGVYLRTGVLFSLLSKLNEDVINSNTYGPPGFPVTYITEISTEYSGRFSLGVYGSLGISFDFNESIGIFAESDFITQNWAPEKSLITMYKENGTDYLSNLSVNEKETHYVDEIHIDQNTPSGPNEPEISLIESKPFSSCVISIGFHWNIGGGIGKENKAE